jgi:hypothetical protein
MQLGLARIEMAALLSAFSDLQPVAVRVQELRDVAPGELEHVRLELHAARLQLLGCLPDIVGLDRDRRRDAALYRLGLPRCTGPPLWDRRESRFQGGLRTEGLRFES